VKVDFPAGSTWIAFTDQVSHAATAGQYQLEQTFLLPVDAMADPERSPLRVLERIMGRRRNMLTLPDGRSFWPSFSARRLQKIVPIREHQFRQTAPLVIEALLVTEAPISPAQESAMRDIINAGLPMGFDIRIRCLDAIPRSTSGKYEEFVSAIEPVPVV